MCEIMSISAYCLFYNKRQLRTNFFANQRKSDWPERFDDKHFLAAAPLKKSGTNFFRNLTTPQAKRFSAISLCHPFSAD